MLKRSVINGLRKQDYSKTGERQKSPQLPGEFYPLGISYVAQSQHCMETSAGRIEHVGKSIAILVS